MHHQRRSASLEDLLRTKHDEHTGRVGGFIFQQEFTDLLMNEPTSMIADDGTTGCLVMFGGPGLAIGKGVTG